LEYHLLFRPNLAIAADFHRRLFFVNSSINVTPSTTPPHPLQAPYNLALKTKTTPKGEMNMDGQELVKQTLDQIPQAKSNAKRIVGLVKEGGRITGYQLSDNSIVEKQQAVNMAKQGQIAGVGIAHRGDTEYLKSIPDGSENNNLGNLPSVSPDSQS
jgi:hypothetical protein